MADKNNNRLVPQYVGNLKDGTPVTSDEDILKRRKQVYEMHQNDHKVSKIAETFGIKEMTVYADIRKWEKQQDKKVEKNVEKDEKTLRSISLQKIKDLYDELWNILRNSNSNNEKINAAKVLRGLAKDERDFLLEIGMITKQYKGDVKNEIDIDGIPISELPTQTLLNRGQEILQNFSNYADNKKVKDMLKNIKFQLQQNNIYIDTEDENKENDEQ